MGIISTQIEEHYIKMRKKKKTPVRATIIEEDLLNSHHSSSIHVVWHRETLFDLNGGGSLQ